MSDADADADTVTSAKTFDAGVAVYGAMAAPSSPANAGESKSASAIEQQKRNGRLK